MFIGGGWVRDVLFGIIPKDIDVFLAYRTDNFAYEPTNLPNNFKMKVCLNADYGAFRDGVLYLEKFEDIYANDTTDVGTTVDILHMLSSGVVSNSAINDIVSGFDCSICQVYAKVELIGDMISSQDGLCFYVSSHFLEGYKNRVIYHYEDIPVREDHRDRMIAKFPDYTWESKTKDSRDNMQFTCVATWKENGGFVLEDSPLCQK